MLNNKVKDFTYLSLLFETFFFRSSLKFGSGHFILVQFEMNYKQ